MQHLRRVLTDRLNQLSSKLLLRINVTISFAGGGEGVTVAPTVDCCQSISRAMLRFRLVSIEQR